MSLFDELRRRNVFRVAAAYAVAGWLLIEISSVALEAFGAPAWVPKSVGVLLLLGLPVALFFAWAYEVTPEGIKRESEVDRSRSITRHTGRRLDLVTLVLLVTAIGLVLTQQWWRPAAPIGTSPSVRTDLETVSVAVLPFTNMSTDAENAYFADGISEEILNLLAGVRDLEVASRTSAFASKESSASIPEIASALGVRYVLEGSVRKAGEQVRITAQLIDAGNDRHLWSENYDRALDDIFAIQDEIAAAIGRALRVELLGQGGERISAESIDAEVYAEFLQARYQLRRRNTVDLIAAVEKLIRVVTREPDFARGHAVLGEAYLLHGLERTGAVSRDIAFLQARYHATVAGGLDPDLGGTPLVLGLLAGIEGDRLAALVHFDKAMALEPEEPRPYHWRAIQYAESGLLERALKDLERAVELEPDNANANGELAAVLFALGQVDEAMARTRRQIELGNPREGHIQRGLFEVFLGQPGRARESFDAIRGMADPVVVRFLDAVLAAADDPAAVGPLTELLAGDTDLSEDRIEWALLALGLDEQLLERFADGVEMKGQAYLMWHDRFRAMRADPRFIDSLSSAGRTQTWSALGPPPDCRKEGAGYRCGLAVETTD